MKSFSQILNQDIEQGISMAAETLEIKVQKPRVLMFVIDLDRLKFGKISKKDHILLARRRNDFLKKVT